EFFDDLDADNGASRLARLLIEECTELHLFVGTAVNEAHKETELNFDLSMRQNLVDQLVRTAEEMDKRVTVKYY
ncbi:MAG TPA: serine/threonine-protein phosphatase, partial [Candidatus Mediterraneibacter stercoravium]|nr:serine/threonine-protein phosphatase [Candidatus Mediterraneibacter stercoravium]